MAKAEKRDKKDRTARLFNIEHLLHQNKDGLHVGKIAEECGVCKRTTYRDLEALEKIGFPIWEKSGKRGIAEGYFLPPIHFTLPEALNIFLVTRLMLRYTNKYDPTTASTFIKLNSIIPSPLKEQIQKTLDWMNKLPRDEKYLRILGTLAEAWTSRQQVRIAYQALDEDKPAVRIIEPYYIEPAAPGHSSYVIAYCYRAKDMRIFKIERIESIWATTTPYIIPDSFDANTYFDSSWGIVAGGQVEDVKLKFSPEIARIMKETRYHPSQKLSPQKDGTIIMTLSVSVSQEFCAWILGWGEKVEVMEPKSLRNEISHTAREILKVYRKK